MMSASQDVSNNNSFQTPHRSPPRDHRDPFLPELTLDQGSVGYTAGVAASCRGAWHYSPTYSLGLKKSWVVILQENSAQL